jgi:hypothetical protein
VSITPSIVWSQVGLRNVIHFLKFPGFPEIPVERFQESECNKQETSGTRISGKAGNLENFLATLVTG